MDRSDLLLFVEEEADDAGQEALAQQGGAATAQGGGGAKGGEGPPKEQTGRSQWRLLSLQEVFELMVRAWCSCALPGLLQAYRYTELRGAVG